MFKKVGVFGGSFDPVHLGHIGVAVALKEAHALDHIYFVPAQRNPLKGNDAVASYVHRCQMLQNALNGVPGCSVHTCEGERPAPSYAIDTVRALQEALGPECALYLLMGEDALDTLASWKEIHELVRLAPPLIACRHLSHQHGSGEGDPTVRAAVSRGMTKTPYYEISATDIRQRLRAGLFCGHLLDRLVLDYIERHGLYREAT